MCHWIVSGVGIQLDDLPLNNQKCLALYKEVLPDIPVEDETAFDIRDYLNCNPFEGIKNLFYYADKKDVLICDSDGEGNNYLYYPPTMPWERRTNDPETLLEAHDIIREAVKNLTDLSDSEIEALINDDLYEYGCG